MLFDRICTENQCKSKGEAKPVIRLSWQGCFFFFCVCVVSNVLQTGEERLFLLKGKEDCSTSHYNNKVHANCCQ